MKDKEFLTETSTKTVAPRASVHAGNSAKAGSTLLPQREGIVAAKEITANSVKHGARRSLENECTPRKPPRKLFIDQIE